MRSGRHHGAPIPASPGSTRAPPESSASRASSPSAAGSAATPSSRHSHSSIAPAANTPPSSAYSVRPAIVQATVGSRPPAGRRDLLADVREHEHPGPVGGLDPAGNDGAGSGERRLLVDGLPAQAQLGRPARVASVPSSPAVSRSSRQHLGRDAERRAQRGVEGAGRVDALQLGPGRGGRVGGEPGAQAIAEERVDRAHPQGAGVARGRHLVGVLQQPGELGGGEVGIVGKAARLLDRLLVARQPVEHLLRPLVLPDDDRAQRLAALGIPGEHRLALVVEPAGHHLARGIGEQLGDRLDHRGQHLLAVLLDPAGLRMAVDLVAPRLAHRPQLAVEQHRLDPGGALVDPEEQPLGHRTCSPPAATRAATRARARGAAAPAARQLAPGRRARPRRRRPARRRARAIPSEAESPVERIAATLISRGQRRRGADQVVAAAPGGAQARVARDRLRALERGQHRAPPSASPRRTPPGARDQSSLSSWSWAVGPAITLPSTVGNTSTPLVRFARHRQQDPLERLAAGRLEDEELALARVDREALVAGEPRDLVGAQAGAVDRHAAAQHGRRPRCRSGKPVAARARSPSTRRAGAQLGAGRDRGADQRPGVGDRVGDRLARDLERAVVAERRVDAVAPRAIGQRRDRARLAPSPGAHAAPRSGSPARRAARAPASGAARRAQDQLGLQLARRRSRSPCGGSRSWCRWRRARARPRPRAIATVAPRATSACATAAPTTPAPTTADLGVDRA